MSFTENNANKEMVRPREIALQRLYFAIAEVDGECRIDPAAGRLPQSSYEQNDPVANRHLFPCVPASPGRGEPINVIGLPAALIGLEVFLGIWDNQEASVHIAIGWAGKRKPDFITENIGVRCSKMGRRKSRNEVRTETGIRAVLSVDGRDFTFDLCRRVLDFNLDEPLDYFWMNASAIRNPLKSGDGNVKACFGFWYACMQHKGYLNSDDAVFNLVLASHYLQICTNKSLQYVYQDAFLNQLQDARIYGASSQKAGDETSLSAADRAQIRSVVEARDRLKLKQEFDGVFGLLQVPEESRSWLDNEFADKMAKGIARFRSNGLAGIVEYTAEVSADLCRRRRRSDAKMAASMRNFINLFSYNAKVAFHVCFANAWQSIIPTLAHAYGLDKPSIRFLSLWHQLNPGVEVSPKKQKVGRISSSDPNSPQDGVFHADVFSGQILSLHPISAFIMKDCTL